MSAYTEEYTEYMWVYCVLCITGATDTKTEKWETEDCNDQTEGGFSAKGKVLSCYLLSITIPPLACIFSSDGAEGAQHWWEHQDGGRAWDHERARRLHSVGGEEPPGNGTQLDAGGEAHRPSLGYVCVCKTSSLEDPVLVWSSSKPAWILSQLWI